MNLIKYFTILFMVFICGFLVACQTSTSRNQMYARDAAYIADVPIQKVYAQRRVPAFYALDVGNNFRVIITGESAPQKVVLIGDAQAVAEVSTVVQNGTLVLRHQPEASSVNPPLSSLVTVKINMGSLSSLKVSGNSTVTADTLQGNSLSITAEGRSQIFLRGVFNVRKIRNDSSGNIDIARLHAQHLHVSGEGTGRIRLAGNVHILTVRLGNLVCLEAEYLRAGEVHVQTKDMALAEVLPVDALYAFANDNSNIFYFKVPKVTVITFQDSGNILKVANWN